MEGDGREVEASLACEEVRMHSEGPLRVDLVPRPRPVLRRPQAHIVAWAADTIDDASVVCGFMKRRVEGIDVL